jgi:hypothetical protein
MLIPGPAASTEPGADEDDALARGLPKAAKADTSVMVHL